MNGCAAGCGRSGGRNRSGPRPGGATCARSAPTSVRPANGLSAANAPYPPKHSQEGEVPWKCAVRYLRRCRSTWIATPAENINRWERLVHGRAGQLTTGTPSRCVVRGRHAVQSSESGKTSCPFAELPRQPERLLTGRGEQRGHGLADHQDWLLALRVPHDPHDPYFVPVATALGARTAGRWNPRHPDAREPPCLSLGFHAGSDRGDPESRRSDAASTPAGRRA
jgi:hypothetical protein